MDLYHSLVGTVWDDLNANEMYDPGEGLADVSVVPDSEHFHAGPWEQQKGLAKFRQTFQVLIFC